MRQLSHEINLLSSVDMNLLLIKVPSAVRLEAQHLFRLWFASLGDDFNHRQARESFRWSHVNKRSIYAL